MSTREEEVTQILEPQEDEHTNGHHPGAASSVWDALQAKRALLGEDRHLDLEVPGTFGMFTLRLGPVSGRKQAQLTDRLQKSRSPDRDFNLNADYLIAACQGVLARHDAADDLELMVDELGEPIKLDSRLAQAFGLPSDTPGREIVRRLYGGAPSPEMSITMAGGEYVGWAAGMTPELDEEALGEA